MIWLLGLGLSVIAGLIPAVLYVGFVIWLDRYEKEPWWLMLLSFLWGAIPAVLAALVAQILLEIPTTWVLDQATLAYEIVGASMWAPVTEELAKGMGVILILLLARQEIDSVLDGIVYGALAGLGFAFTENVLYFVAAVAEDGWGAWAVIVLMRTIPFGLNHALFTGLTGAGVATVRLGRTPLIRIVSLPAGLVAGMGIHSLHNLGASLAGESCAPICLSFLFDWGGVLLLGVLVGLVWRQEKTWILANLPGEVDEQTLTTLTTWLQWQTARWGALLRIDISGWRRLGEIRQNATEIAFKKQRRAEGRLSPGLDAAIDTHRLKLDALGASHVESAQPVGDLTDL